MYTNNKGFGLKDLIIKIIFVALFVLLLIWLFRNYSPNMKPFYSNVFRENISYMQDAAKSYFTNDKLPTEIGSTTRLTLKQMEDMKLVVPFVDKDGNSCDVNESYADVTKEEEGYTLKVNLVCGSESDYLIEILGCHDYCNNCTAQTATKTALEYQFKRTVKKDQTVFTCPKGYTRDGSVCSKKSGTETIAAISNFTDARTEISDVLYTTGASQKIEVDTIKNTTSTTTKQYADVTVKETTSKEYKDRIEGTKTSKSYTNAITSSNTTKSYTDAITSSNTTKSYTTVITSSNTTKSYVSYQTITTTTCKDVKVKDPNCSVQCKWVTGSNGIPQEVCNTCGYVIHKECTDSTAYICPNGYISEGSGSSLKCYKNVTNTAYVCPSGYTAEGSGSNTKCYKNATNTTYSCPNGYTAEGSGSSLKCYKNVTSKTYSCPSGYTAEGSGSSLKCYKNVTSKTYSCPSGYTAEGSGSSLKCYKNVTNRAYSCGSGLIKEGSGSSTKCYRNVTTTNTTYSCPTGTTSNGKTGLSLKCYKTVSGEKIAYCANPSAKIQNNKCVLTISKTFSHYSCKDGYTLNKANGTCSRDIVDTVKVTSSTTTKDVTETKWSREKTLAGWTATGKTRTVTVK